MPPDNRSAILQGTLDLMVLKTLAAMGPMHGYGHARRIEQISERRCSCSTREQSTCAHIRLVQRRWISARWGISENNRKAKFYADYQGGRKQLTAETDNWAAYPASSDDYSGFGAKRVTPCCTD